MGVLHRRAYVYNCGKFAVREIVITEMQEQNGEGVLFPLSHTKGSAEGEPFSFDSSRRFFRFSDSGEEKDSRKASGSRKASESSESDESGKLNKLFILPGFVDVHVHLREPGFSYKETIYSGTRAAAAGGFTAVCSMPNLDPPPDSPENLKVQTDIIEKDACIHVYPYGCITKGSRGAELSDMDRLADKVIAFTDDGRGVQNDDIMYAAMKKATSLGKIIAAHCEDERSGTSPESEYMQLKRDISLVAKTGCRYHMCHASTKESVDMIREAKKAGLPVSAETAPHYLLFSDDEIKDSGDYKMNPPIRSRRDREALIEAISDGTIDMIATDHAPHSEAEKSGGFAASLNGIVGLETSFALMYTYFVRKKIISPERLMALMCDNPRKIFSLPQKSDEGIIIDAEEHFTVKRDRFISKGRAMPYEGSELYGKCLATFINGRTVR